MQRVTLGAYILPGDPVWLRSSLRRIYPLLDRLVVPVPEDGRGWRGRTLPVRHCLDIVHEIDTRGIVTEVPGRWMDRAQPLRAETRQRQAAVDALTGTVDWILQFDGDELLRVPDGLQVALDAAERAGLDVVELPMQILFRRLRDGRHLVVTDVDGAPIHEYPGPVAVRSGVTLTHARRTDQPFLRAVVRGDHRSIQVARSPEPGEHRVVCLDEAPILHNSWARTPQQIWRKTGTWGHAGPRASAFVLRRWLPAPLIWQRQRDLHPFSGSLWPALRPLTVSPDDLAPEDR